jgi:hypothetical protein
MKLFNYKSNLENDKYFIEHTLNAFLINADSLDITALSSAAVLHCLIYFITSRSFKFDIFVY